jgi:hypothetical protein
VIIPNLPEVLADPGILRLLPPLLLHLYLCLKILDHLGLLFHDTLCQLQISLVELPLRPAAPLRRVLSFATKLEALDELGEEFLFTTD